jgi:multicomponent K+:H+ antiporter subunit F
MSGVILGASLLVAKIFLTLAMTAATYRVLYGPRAQDRVLGMDTLYVNAMLLLLVFGIGSSSQVYFELSLIIALLGFMATVAMAKFLMRGEVIE